MQCAFCGHSLTPGVPRCPRCGGAVASSPSVVTGQIFASASFPLPASYEPPPPPPPTSQVASTHPSDPEIGLRTALVSLGDRQEVIETKLVEAPPPSSAPETAEQRGLPDSRVARGVEDTLVEIKRMIYRFGRIGRLAFYSHVLIILGSVSPWYHMPRQGYSPGIEGWGALPVALAFASIGTLLWRHRHKPTHRILPVLLHLLLGASLVLVILWQYKQTLEIAPHLRPDFAFGFYLSALGGLGALLGSLFGLKDLR